MSNICRRNLSDNHRRWCPYPQGKRRLYYHPRFSLPCALCRVRCGLAVASDLAVDQRAPEGKQGRQPRQPTHGGKAPKWGIANRLSPRSAPALRPSGPHPIRPCSALALRTPGPIPARPSTNTTLLPLQRPSAPSAPISPQRSPTTTCWPCGNAESTTTHRHAQPHHQRHQHQRLVIRST
jgi:hypothetical protein